MKPKRAHDNRLSAKPFRKAHGSLDSQYATFHPIPSPNWKKWAFRLAALGLIPVILLGLIELLLRLSGYGYATSFFLNLRLGEQPVIIENQKFGWQFFPPRAARTPQAMAFPRRKENSACRIFVFGESAAMGDPEPAYGMPRFLEMMLRARYPGQIFEIINVAMTAINSHAILSIAKDCAQRQGDIWIIYMGNNEVVGPYGAGTVFGNQAPPRWFVQASLALRKWRVVQWGEDGWRRLRKGQSRPSSWEGMELFTSHLVRQQDAKMKRVYGNFEKNLRDIIAMGRQSGAQVVVSTILSNLRDCAPFASLHRPNLREEEQRQWESAYQAGIKAATSRQIQEALGSFQGALSLDAEYAELHFYLAHAWEALGDLDKARQHYQRARDLDGLRFRADTTINNLIRGSVDTKTERIHLVDTEALLGKKEQIPGHNLLWEHVHLNLDGNYAVARLLAEKVDSIYPFEKAKIQPWPDQQRCLELLGFTKWDAYEVLGILKQRIERAPFTQQANHQEHFQRHLDQMERLRAQLTPTQLETAIQIGRSALEKSPGDWILQERLARRLKQQGDMDGAISLWEAVIARLPHYAEGQYQLGLTRFGKGQVSEAANKFRNALKIRPDYPEALDGLGQVLVKARKVREAQELFKKSLEIKPGYSEAHAHLARAYEEGGESDLALKHYQEAARLKPDNADASTGLGRLLDRQGQLSEEIELYRKSLAANPQDASTHYNLGNALRGLGRVAEAKAHYQEAIRLKPEYAEAHNKLGFEMARQGQDSEALRHFSEAIRLNPDLAEAHLNLGVALARLHRVDEAVRHFTEALRLNPQDLTARKYLEAAQSLRRKGVESGSNQ